MLVGKAEGSRGFHCGVVGFGRRLRRRLRRLTRSPTNPSTARPDKLTTVSRTHSIIVSIRNRISSMRLMVGETKRERKNA
jgi:hypothetical protein